MITKTAAVLICVALCSFLFTPGCSSEKATEIVESTTSEDGAESGLKKESDPSGTKRKREGPEEIGESRTFHSTSTITSIVSSSPVENNSRSSKELLLEIVKVLSDKKNLATFGIATSISEGTSPKDIVSIRNGTDYEIKKREGGSFLNRIHLKNYDLDGNHSSAHLEILSKMLGVRSDGSDIEVIDTVNLQFNNGLYRVFSVYRENNVQGLGGYKKIPFDHPIVLFYESVIDSIQKGNDPFHKYRNFIKQLPRT